MEPSTLLFHGGVVLALAIACILFGLLRASSSHEETPNPCGACDEGETCDRFSFVGSVSRCDKR